MFDFKGFISQQNVELISCGFHSEESVQFGSERAHSPIELLLL